MVVRRDQRRRRVIMDETVRTVSVPDFESTAADTEIDTQDGNATAPSEFNPRVRSRVRMRSTNLLPKRRLPYTAFFICVLLSLVALNLLAHYSSFLEPAIGKAGVSALALTGAGSVANWFLGFLFTLSSLVCLQIYALRKHRADDYRGTYRIWIWASLIFLSASLGCVVPLAAIFEHILLSITKPEYVRNVLLVVVAQAAILSLLFVRGLFEIRASKGTLSLLCISWGAVIGTVCLKLPQLAERIEGDQQLAYGNMLLISAAGLFLTVVTFARYVYLESNGLVRAKVSKQSSSVSVASTQAQVGSSTEKSEKPAALKKATRAKAKKSRGNRSAESAASQTKADSKSNESVTPPVPQVSSEQEAELKKLAEAQKAANNSTSSRKKKKTGNRPPVPPPATEDNATPLQVAQLEDDFEEPTTRKMTKSESRKARKLKKQQRRQQRRAA